MESYKSRLIGFLPKILRTSLLLARYIWYIFIRCKNVFYYSEISKTVRITNYDKTKENRVLYWTHGNTKGWIKQGKQLKKDKNHWMIKKKNIKIQRILLKCINDSLSTDTFILYHNSQCVSWAVTLVELSIAIWISYI